MGCARYVGRVGALAVALGIGVAVANGPVVAWADDGAGSSSGSAASGASSDGSAGGAGESGASGVSGEGSAGEDSSGVDGDESASAGEDVSEPESGDDSEAGEGQSEESGSDGSDGDEAGADDDAGGKKSAKRKSQRQSVSPNVDVKPQSGVSASSTVKRSKVAKSESAPAVASVATAKVQPPASVSKSVVSAPVSVAAAAADVAVSTVQMPVQAVTGVLSSLLALNPLIGGGRGDSPDSPFAWGVMAALRRMSAKDDVDEKVQSAADPVVGALSVEDPQPMLMAAAAVANSAPTAVPTSGAPDPLTGRVTGSMNAVDPEGNPLTYQVTGQSAGTTVSLDGAGNFSYTPTNAARVAAASTSGLDTDTFTVRVSDGQVSQDVAVSVVVRPATIQSSGQVAVGAGPSGVAVKGTRAYVANKTAKTVSVIDTATGAVVATIGVSGSPAGIAVSSKADRAYVAMGGTNSVAVIDTATNKVIDVNPATASVVDAIKVGTGPESIVVSPDGKRVYVANSTATTVSVIDTATNTELTKLTVGSIPRGLAVSADSSKLYALAAGVDKMVVFNTATNAQIGSAVIGDAPRDIVLSANGQRAYVTDYNEDKVSVVNLAGATPVLVTKITVGDRPEGIAMSADGTQVFVANGPDTVSVINTATNTVVGTVAIDPTVANAAHRVAFTADGKAYVTDYADNLVRILSLARVQTAPVATGVPSVGTPASADGKVIGDLKVIDTDGDPLTYNVVDTPDRGTLTIDAKGVYTYTPTPAARQSAATSGPTTDSFTVNVTDTLSATKAISLTVPISPQAAPGLPQVPVTTTTIRIGSPPGVLNPSGNYGSMPTAVVVVGQKVYVSDAFGLMTAAIDSTTGQVTEIPGNVWAPWRAAASPASNSLYVIGGAYDGVDVIDTRTNQVVGFLTTPVQIGGEGWTNLGDVAVSRDGTRIYIPANDGRLWALNTSTNAVIGSIDIGVLEPDVEVSADGRTAYYTAGDRINLVDTATMTAVGVIPVSSTGDMVVSPDGRRIYVAGSNGTVSIIDTASKTVVKEVSTTTGLQSIAISPDGKRAYVAATDGKTVTVIDTQSNQAIGTFTTDQSGGPGRRDIAVSADGSTIYVTDANDGVIYANRLASPPVTANQAPQAGMPSVVATNRGTGAVSGLLNFTDPENGPMTYTVPAQPSSGTVTIAGSTYTFTPTQSARDAAAISPGPDAASITVRANDGEASSSVTFSVPILPPNHAPVAGTPSVGEPVIATGAVSGSLNFTDADDDSLTYSVANQPVGGTVTFSGSTYTFTPTQAAREVAHAGGATSTSVTVIADDGMATGAVTFSVPISPAPPVNQAPLVFGPSFRGTDALTGKVIGALQAIDPEDDSLSFTVTSQGANGTATIDASGVFTYTPTEAARLSAWMTSTTDRFTVTVSDGHSTATKDVKVNVSSAVFEGLSSSAQLGSSPMGVAVSSTKTYVTNQASGTVSVIDRANLSATPLTISVVSSPTAIALGPAGSNRAYVAGNNGVSVINIVTNQVVGTVTLNGGQSSGIAVAPNGQRVYVTMSGTNKLAVINANTAINSYTVAGTPVTVGTYPTGITLSGDGSRAFVANRNSNSVTVLDISTATPTVLRTITIGSAPNGIAANFDGTRVFVSNSSSNSVSVLNPTASTPLLASIPLGTQPFGITLNLDGTVLYVANANDTVSVIDTRNYNLIVPIVMDYASESSLHSIGLSPDGRSLYVSDASDRVVRTVYVTKQANQPPWIPGSTIPRTLDPVTGAVTGYVNAQDREGDILTFSLASPPTQGGTVTLDQTSGAFTFTPSASARALAAQTQGIDYDTFGVDISDGIATARISVTAQVAPALPPSLPVTNTPVNTGAGPSGSAVSNGYTYVANYSSNNVSVINSTTQQLVKLLEVGAGPLSIVAVDTAQRKRVYVSNLLSNTVSVIDPATNTVVKTITIDIPPFTYENPEYGPIEVQNRIAEMAANGNRLYVNATDGNIRVFDTTNDTNALLRTTSMGVFNNLELSPDGSRLYATWTNGLNVINTATMESTTVQVGPDWVVNQFGNRVEDRGGIGQVALSPDGKRAYVGYGIAILQSGVGGQPYGSFISTGSGTWMYTGSYSAISVIDTDTTSVNYNKEIARVQVPLGSQGMVVSGSNLYIANTDNKTVTVLDTTTNKLVGSFTTDQTTAGRDPIWVYSDLYNTGYVNAPNRNITVGPNGTLLVTDYADGKLYAVNVGNPNM